MNIDPRISTSLIALFGVFVSVFVTYLSSRALLKSKIRELETETLLQNSDRLIQKRLEVYPLLYYILSDMLKKIKKDLLKGQAELINKDLINSFFEEYEELNSKFGIFFSTQSGLYSSMLRNYLFLLLNKDDVLNTNVLKELKSLIGDLEFSLKQEIGVYIDELQSSNTGRNLKKYSDVNNKSVDTNSIRKEKERKEEEVIVNLQKNKQSYT